MTRNENEVCLFCKFWVNGSDEDSEYEYGEYSGICRRNAPKPKVSLRSNMPDNTYFTEWPTTFGDDWCGEFKSSEVQNEGN